MGENAATGPRVAIVTGGSRGIGRSVVEELAGDGLAVVVGYAANHAEATVTVAAAEAKGARAIRRPADIASVVAFLASPAGHWVNGQTIKVNGGIN